MAEVFLTICLRQVLLLGPLFVGDKIVEKIHESGILMLPLVD
jgi:hypothetical protein